MMEPMGQRAVGRQAYPSTAAGGREPANLGDILERVLDRGVIIAGDIRVNLLDIELLTIKLRLIIASVDTAKEMGIDWWEHDPWLSGRDRHLVEENRRLRNRLAELEEGPPRRSIEGEVEPVEERPPRRRRQEVEPPEQEVEPPEEGRPRRRRHDR
ncbi:gas vesicle protein GvpJ [Nonomuraea lactucae]|uniref:gas vesicle protein GvpJ n=1 Tax=Nonomuraea lactucae TaxID=2249762 RepID=UPI001F060E4E|nr:gas vesicle protein GvpJ [Nonomuraea lactucae]